MKNNNIKEFFNFLGIKCNEPFYFKLDKNKILYKMDEKLNRYKYDENIGSWIIAYSFSLKDLILKKEEIEKNI